MGYEIKIAATPWALGTRGLAHEFCQQAEIAVLDRLSNGRLILGLGRGIQPSMFAAFELPSNEKRKRFQANLKIMLNAWAGKPITTDAADKPVHLACPINSHTHPYGSQHLGPWHCNRQAS